MGPTCTDLFTGRLTLPGSPPARTHRYLQSITLVYWSSGRVPEEVDQLPREFMYFPWSSLTHYAPDRTSNSGVVVNVFLH